jgi:hypothetical protein
VLVVAAALGVGACTTSGVRSTDTIHITGEVASADGTPAPGRNVLVRKALSSFELSGRMQALLSADQLACVADHPPGACPRSHYLHTTRTAADGSFAVTLTGQDVQTGLGLLASRMDAAVTAPPGAGQLSGGASSASFEVQVTQFAVPTLRVWTTPPSLGPAPGGARVQWIALGPDFGPSPSYRVVFDDGAGGLVWQSGALAGRTSYDIDARILEDIGGAVSVLATTQTPATHTTVALAYRSPRVAVHGTAGVPVSRGKPCSVLITGGSEPAGSAAGLTRLSPCGLTDGRFDTPALGAALAQAGSPNPAACLRPAGTAPSGAAAGPGPAAGDSPCQSPRATATVDLGTLSPSPSDRLGLIVVRGCPALCGVDVSADGSRWQTAATASAPDAAIPLSPPVAARFVRVAAPATDLAAVTELSAWAVTTRSAQGPPAVVAGGVAPGAPGSGGNSGHRVVLEWLAAAVLAGVAAGAVVVARRPRRV